MSETIEQSALAASSGSRQEQLVMQMAELWEELTHETKCLIYDASPVAGMLLDMAIDVAKGPRETIIGTPETMDEIAEIAMHRYLARNNPA